jgi:hypothetical protein
MKRRNKHRKIKLGNETYLYQVTRLTSEKIKLKVWLLSSRNKNNCLQVKILFHDPWINFGSLITASQKEINSLFQLKSITPQTVKEIIEAAIARGWNSTIEQASLNFVWKNKNLF